MLGWKQYTTWPTANMRCLLTNQLRMTHRKNLAMGYRTLRQCVDDLERSGQLVRVEDQIDACLEAAEIHRRVFQSGGPAIYFARVKGCRFPMLSNLFGTEERMRFLFRDTLHRVRRLVELKIDPNQLWRHPTRYLDVARTALSTLPKRCTAGPVTANTTTVSELPQLKSWPEDGGSPRPALERARHRDSGRQQRPRRGRPIPRRQWQRAAGAGAARGGVGRHARHPSSAPDAEVWLLVARPRQLERAGGGHLDVAPIRGVPFHGPSVHTYVHGSRGSGG